MALSNVPLRSAERLFLESHSTAVSSRPHLLRSSLTGSSGTRRLSSREHRMLLESLPFHTVGPALQPAFWLPWLLSHCLTAVPWTDVFCGKSPSCHMAFCVVKLTGYAEGGIYKPTKESKTMLILHAWYPGLISSKYLTIQTEIFRAKRRNNTSP